MFEPTMVENYREQVQNRIKARQLQILAEKKEHMRAQEIRRLAREYLLHARDLRGTREEMLRCAISRATRIYDDVEAFEIKHKEEQL